MFAVPYIFPEQEALPEPLSLQQKQLTLKCLSCDDFFIPASVHKLVAELLSSDR